jgi:hypothetical protein
MQPQSARSVTDAKRNPLAAMPLAHCDQATLLAHQRRSRKYVFDHSLCTAHLEHPTIRAVARRVDHATSWPRFGLCETQHHHGVASGCHEIVALLHHLAIFGVIQPELIQVLEDLEAPTLHALKHIHQPGLDAHAAVLELRMLIQHFAEVNGAARVAGAAPPNQQPQRQLIYNEIAMFEREK